MIRRMAVALICALASPAMAGHFTHDRIIGFSPDGGYFAFKTYGLQRGSGLPFANVYVVDLERNAWVAGTPIRKMRDETAISDIEAAPFAALKALRQEAMDAAQPQLRQARITRPATVLYAAGIGQAHQAQAVTRISIPHPDDPTRQPWGAFSLRLSEVDAPAAHETCPRQQDLRGYRLELLHPDGDARILHQDQRIPASRGCAQAYRLDAVVSAGYPQADTALVALISVWQQGLEGLTRHVIAAPLPPLGQIQAQQAVADQGGDQGPDLETVLAGFMQGMDPLDPAALEARLPMRQNADPDALRWPDADLPPVARAIALFAAQDGFAKHGRLALNVQQVDLTPDGAGARTTLSLIRLQAFNLGLARRDDLLTVFDQDKVAPPEVFGIGPDVEWRFAMHAVQGLRAHNIAVGRLMITDADALQCGPVSCQSANPVDGDALGLACAPLDIAPLPGTGTALGQAMGPLADEVQATDWLIEYGLWQAQAMQVLAGNADQPDRCWLALQGPE